MLKTAVFCFRGAIGFYKAIVLSAYANSPRTRCRVSSPKKASLFTVENNRPYSVGTNFVRPLDL